MHRSNGSEYVQVAFKWRGTRKIFSFGYNSDMNLSAAKKYMDEIQRIRTECAVAGTALPIDLPPPKKVPKLGEAIARYKKAIQDLMPADLYTQIVEKHRQEGLSVEEHVRRLKNCERNYSKLMAEHRKKIAEAQRKRLATIAAKKARFNHESESRSTS